MQVINLINNANYLKQNLQNMNKKYFKMNSKIMLDNL